MGSYKYSLGKAGERIRAEDLDRTVEYVPVTRWCRPGFKPGDWVMNREKTLKNHILSFKWDFISPTNKVAPFKSGQTYPVPVT